MSTDERYEGWANRETWAVALHINNDQGWQESVHEALRTARERGELETSYYDLGAEYRATHAARMAGDVIRENVEDTLDQLWFATSTDYRSESTYSLVREDIGSLWRVDWDELGAAFLSDLDES